MMGSMSNRYSGYDNRGSSAQNNYQQQGQGYGNAARMSRERQDIENERRKIEREITESRAELESLRRMKGEMRNDQGSRMQYGAPYGGY